MKITENKEKKTDMNENTMWKFRSVQLEDQDLVNSYFAQLGEGSCQHSFAALYAYQQKYKTELWEQKNCLYIRQPARNEHDYESYLMPMAQLGPEEAVTDLLEFLHMRGKYLKLHTITESAKAFLDTNFPGRFLIEENPDAMEYLYKAEKLAALEGAELQDIRYCYRRFCRRFGPRAEIVPVQPGNLEELLEFQRHWLQGKKIESEYTILKQEQEAIERVCSNFERLGFRGILARIDGRIRGYALGCAISDHVFDVFFEKGDSEIKDIYRCLVTDMVRIHASSYQYINREEDLGDAGMRYAKRSYRPDWLMKKYSAREVCDG